LKPARIYGGWDEGIVIDNHMLKSIFLGYDDNGKEIFKNIRTEIGELIYNFKYKKDKSSLPKIINLTKEFLNKWGLKEKIDIVIPVPPSNRKREYQPVYEIAKEIAKYLEKECMTDLLSKEGNLQVKDGYDIKNMIKQNKKLTKEVNVLIIDDLYSTGSTLNEVCKVLRKDSNVKKIYCLAITRTKG